MKSVQVDPGHENSARQAGPAIGAEVASDPLLASLPLVDGYPKLGPCLLMSEVGGGAMGKVYRAYHLRFEFDVAVKVLNWMRLGRDTAIRGRFRREAQIGAAITSENLVRVYDTGEEHGLQFLVMEWIPGENVEQRLRRNGGALPAEEVVEIAAAVARGLAAAHDGDVVHRDVKPQNILISTEGICKLSDLGLAKFRSVPSQLSGVDDVCGTAEYMPLEQWRGEDVGPAADIYGLGASMYFMLAGQPGVSAKQSPYEILQKLTSGGFPRVAGVLPVDPALAAIVDRCTMERATDRFENGAELRRELEALRPARPLIVRAPLATDLEPDRGARPSAETIARARALAGAETLPPAPSRTGRRWAAAATVLGVLAAGGWVAARAWGSGPAELVLEVDDLSRRFEARSIADLEIPVSGRTEPGAELRIGNRVVPVAANGSFDYRIDVRLGPNRIPVVVRNAAGSVVSKELQVEVRDGIPPQLTLQRIESPIPFESLEDRSLEVSGDTDPDAEIRVDGKRLEVFGSGRFFHTVELQVGDNEWSFVARDPAGNETTRKLSVQLLAPEAGAPVGPDDGAEEEEDVPVESFPPTVEVEYPEDVVLLRLPSNLGQESIELKGRTDPGATAFLGEEELEVGADGRFAHDLTLSKLGEQSWKLEIRNSAGLSTEKTIHVEVEPDRLYGLKPVVGDDVVQLVDPDEGPLVFVRIPAQDAGESGGFAEFYCGKFEVSNRLYRRLVAGDPEARDGQMPAVCSFEEARQWVEKANAELRPEGATWRFGLPEVREHAWLARGVKREHGWGSQSGPTRGVNYSGLLAVPPLRVDPDNPPKRFWDSPKRLLAVGASEFVQGDHGLVHLLGNVAEWCLSRDPSTREGAYGGSFLSIARELEPGRATYFPGRIRGDAGFRLVIRMPGD